MKTFSILLAALAAVPAIALPFQAEGPVMTSNGDALYVIRGTSTTSASTKHQPSATASSISPIQTPTISGHSATAPSSQGSKILSIESPLPASTFLSSVVSSHSAAASSPHNNAVAVATTNREHVASSQPSVHSSAAPSSPSSVSYSAALPTASSASVSAAASNGVLRGVNVGNWLIIEPWMDDGSLMIGKYKSAADQWSFDSLDTDGSDIKKHWSSWFTESDVQKLASFGFNALRIPIGYWAFDNSGTPYHKGAADYLDQAIGWARKSGMKVLVDCHGSPGSQNGQMHSGHAGAIAWQQGDNLDASTKILQMMVQRYGGQNDSDVVWGLEIVNEPTAGAPNNFATSQQWTTTTYSALQQTISQNNLNKDIKIITHDSFMGPTKFVSLLSDVKSPVTQNTLGVDQHNYQLYTDSDNALNQQAHISEACNWSQNLAQTKSSSMPVIVGEWSALTNICVNSDGSTKPSSGCSTPGQCTTCATNTWSPALVEQVRKYTEAQLDTYEANADGHFFWNFKAGQNSGWSVYDLVNVQAFPNPITDRKYSHQC